MTVEIIQLTTTGIEIEVSLTLDMGEVKEETSGTGQGYLDRN